MAPIGDKHAWARGSRWCLAALVAASSALAASSPAATAGPVVGATVPSATNVTATSCAPGTASVTDFGALLPAAAVRTPSDCIVEFGSSNDTSMLRLHQRDLGGDAMRPGPASGTGVLGFWSFNGAMADLADQSSTANAASQPTAGLVPLVVAGPAGYGSALDFDGTNDRVAIPYDASYNVASLTVDAWINAPSSEVEGYVATRGATACSAPGLCSWAIWIDASGRLEINVERGGAEQSLNTGIDVTDGTWHHVAFSISVGNVLRAYIDGIERGTPSNLGGPIDLGAAAVQVAGSADDEPTARFDGSVDELRITAGAASPTDIRRWATARIRDYVDGSNDFDTPGAGLFGACLESVSQGATDGAGAWTATPTCPANDGAWWKPVVATGGTAGALVARAPSGDIDARAHLRFAMRTTGTQAPGAYEAPITFEVIAPAS